MLQQLARYPVDAAVYALGRVDNLADGLVDSTASFSGAEVVACCTDAAMLAVTRSLNARSDNSRNDVESRILLSDLQSAITAIIPQITPEMLQFYDRINSGD
jgi:SpoVK/Ycf46/Vps4 family AAA+-type ATPase